MTSHAEIATRSSFGSVITACFLYAVALAILFHRLFLGEVLHPGASSNEVFLFVPGNRIEVSPYVSAAHGDVWQHTILFQQGQRDAWLSGRFPTWNPDIFCGFPFHANCTSAVLSPFNLPYFWFEPNLARGPLAILRLWIAGVAAFFFASRFGISWTGSFLTGLTWMLCSFNIHWLMWGLPSNTTIWLPVLLVALDRLVVGPAFGRFSVAGLAATVLFLSGHPETQFQAGLVAALYVVARAVHLRIPARSVIWRLCLAFLAMCGGLAGSAAALWPFLDQLLVSVDWVENIHSKPSLPAQAFLLFLLPDYFGCPRAHFDHEAPFNYVEASCSFGFIPLALAIGCIIWCLIGPYGRNSDDRRWFCRVNAMVVALSILLAFQWTPVQRVIAHMPLLNQCNNIRFLFAVQFAGALLAGVGFDLLVSGATRGIRGIVLGATCAANLLIIGLLVSRQWPPFKGAFDDFRLVVMVHHPLVRCAVTAFLAMLALWVLFGLIVASRGSKPIRQSVACFIPVLVAADLLWAAWDFNPICPVRMAEPTVWVPFTEVVRQAGPQRVLIVGAVNVPNLGMRLGGKEVGGYDIPIARRLAHVLRRIDIPLRWSIFPPSRFFPSVDPTLAAFLNRCGASFILSDQRKAMIDVESTDTVERTSWPSILEGPGPLTIYNNPNAYPRVWIARKASPANEALALDWLLDPSVDLREHTVVEHIAGGEFQDAISDEAVGDARIVRDDPERIVIETRSDTGGVCVIADRADSGWRVTIDGVPATPLVANYLFRGVIVPPGEHTIRWTYVCPKLREGIMVSGITIAALILIGILGILTWTRAFVRARMSLPKRLAAEYKVTGADPL